MSRGMLAMLAVIVGMGASPPVRAEVSALGGVQGVIRGIDDAGLGNFSIQVVPALKPAFDGANTPEPTGEKPELLMPGFPDRRVPIGTVGRLHVRLDQPGWLMVWSLAADGAVFPIADGLEPGRRIIRMVPGKDSVIPNDSGFELTVCPPAGQAMFLVLHSQTEPPPDVLRDLRTVMPAVRLQDEGGTARLIDELRRVMANAPGWAARTWPFGYTVTPGNADRRCSTAAALPPPAAALPPAPPRPEPPVAAAPPPPAVAARPRPQPQQPALAWLKPSAKPIAVKLQQTLYRDGDTMVVGVVPPLACPSLMVLALGAGGAIDVLMPNLETSGGLVRAYETVTVPSPGSKLRLRVRNPPQPNTKERIVAVCDRNTDRPAARRLEGDGETVTLRPGEARFVDLERVLVAARDAGSLLVGEMFYTNGVGGR